MKEMNSNRLFRVLLIAGFLFVNLFWVSGQNQAQKSNLFQPTVLIELFSSEGCSSCPFADEFMKEVIQISDSAKMPVYVIDFHVDIWNKSGWVDPFSDSAYSKRQQAYVSGKKWTAMFTPMAIINGGDTNYAGADKRGIGREIQSILSKPSLNYLRTGVTGVENEDSLVVMYQIWGPVDSCELKVAFVQSEINNLVKGGENSGLILHHHNVVKKLFSFDLMQAQGQVKIPVKRDLSFENFRIVVFVQRKADWKIIAADQVTLKN